MQLSDRIKKIRLHHRASQLVFSKELGISRGHISNLETGSAIPSAQLIKLICSTWGTNEKWLKTGEGEMITSMSRREEKEIDEIYDDLAYDHYCYKLKSAQDYLKYLQEKIVTSSDAKTIIKKDHWKFDTVLIEMHCVMHACVGLIETMISRINRDEFLIKESDFFAKESVENNKKTAQIICLNKKDNPPKEPQSSTA